eukprot:4551314-Alexandrium_andersonii.AAC.1
MHSSRCVCMWSGGANVLLVHGCAFSLAEIPWRAGASGKLAHHQKVFVASPLSGVRACGQPIGCS